MLASCLLLSQTADGEAVDARASLLRGAGELSFNT